MSTETNGPGRPGGTTPPLALNGTEPPATGAFPGAPHPAALRGRAAGTGIMAFFALGWTSLGVSDLGAGVGRALFGIAIVLSVTFFVLATRMHRSAAGLPVPAGTALTAEVRRRTARGFGLVLAMEWGGCAVIAVVLALTGHTEALPSLIALIVGLHFLPLAPLFAVPGYRVTAVAMCAVAVVGAFAAALTSADSLWTAVPGLGSAAVLYLTSAYLVRTAPEIPGSTSAG